MVKEARPVTMYFSIMKTGTKTWVVQAWAQEALQNNAVFAMLFQLLQYQDRQAKISKSSICLHGLMHEMLEN